MSAIPSSDSVNTQSPLLSGHRLGGLSDQNAMRNLSGGATGDDAVLGLTEADKLKLTPFQAALNLGKCVVGAGCFVLPKAFVDGGLWASLIGLILLGLLSVYTIKLLARAERMYVARQTPEERAKGNPTYFDIGRNTWPGRTGLFVGGVIWTGTVLTIIGVCGVYLDFIGQEFSEVIDNKLSQRTVMLLAAIPLVFLSWLRSLKYLVHTSLLGDIAVTAGIVATIIYGAVNRSDAVSPSKLPFLNQADFPQFFGQAVFLFAIHIVILPISQSMREPEQFKSVANYSFTFIVIINSLFGFLGYVLYGSEVKGLVIDDVLGTVGTVVKCLLCADLFFTVPIVLTAPRELIEAATIPSLDAWVPGHRTAWENAVRTFTVGLFLCLALAVPNINDLATLVGCVVSPTMGFILPPLLYLHYEEEALSTLSKVGHWAIIVFGAFACVYSTIKQLQSMV